VVTMAKLNPVAVWLMGMAMIVGTVYLLAWL
jgi:hypothetical protein